MLRKAQKSNITVQHQQINATNLEILLSCYRDMQNDKGFTGISEKLLRLLTKQSGQDWQFNLYVALNLESSKSEWIGMLVSVQHGDSATYLIGYSNSLGRNLNANYLLLWNAILDAKRAGLRWFDLGGANKNTPQGVLRFKSGLNGNLYSLSGEFKK